MKLLQAIISLWLLWLPIATAMYFFSNNSKNEVENATLSDMIKLSRMINVTQSQHMSAMKSSDTDDEAYEKMFNYTIENIKESGFKPDKSIIEIVNEVGEVIFLDVYVNNIAEHEDKKLDEVIIKFSTANATYYIKGLATDKTFMNPLSAQLIGIDGIIVEKTSVVNMMESRRIALDEEESIRIMLELSKLKGKKIEDYLPAKALILINSEE